MQVSTNQMATASRAINQGPAEGRDGGFSVASVARRAIPTRESPGALVFAPGVGSAVTIGTALANAAENLGLKVDRAARPAEGRDGASVAALRRTRLRPLAGDAPVGTAPLTGSSDDEGGEGSGLRRRGRTILGAANVRRPVLTSRRGARFLGR